ncbi:hypothetical protein HIMB11_00409 [Rhodobacteraceae bacterium HIMB11]|nr:hypothetical protein HIMB11_00409 [Rhodobacteraceae bacterium HIMB11]
MFEGSIESLLAAQSAASYNFLNVAIAFLLTFFQGLILVYVYQRLFSGPLLQRNFSATILLVGLITTGLITAINGNLSLSLGMVGALSIVRFRTPVKDPIDLIFIFGSIANGVTNAVSLFLLSSITTVTISIVALYLVSSLNKRFKAVLVIRGDIDIEAYNPFDQHRNINGQLKSAQKYGDIVEQVYELETDQKNLELLKDNLKKLGYDFDLASIK